MKQISSILFIVLLFGLTAGCSQGQAVQDEEEESYSSETEAVERTPWK
ncbi:hypothetical protein GLW04_02190 [Halobacillus litoralis]|uniref:Uncharacterized protein n=1 Tax=Halobacillus litoralis TaxID=45668 RepID=A0A845DP28_9BACI|nr:hypothetical protein [Halobacillus litoralis]MYL18679.1 hypothetical protein [Halobacillus litoralis]MYL39116.1 hypothetical protein [Halobacillus litoralis]